MDNSPEYFPNLPQSTFVLFAWQLYNRVQTNIVGMKSFKLPILLVFWRKKLGIVF